MGCLPSRPQPSTSTGPAQKIPISDLVSFALDRQHLYDQNKPLFIDADDPVLSLSASQTIALVSRLVAGLRAAGLKRGDVVLLHLGNHVSIIPDLLLCVVFSVLHYPSHPSQRTLQKWSPASPFFPAFSLLIRDLHRPTLSPLSGSLSRSRAGFASPVCSPFLRTPDSCVESLDFRPA